VDLAKQLEKMGAQILAIKDMAGLCKPPAARLLVQTLKQEIGIPIHFHTHDTAGIQASSILSASEVGLEVADAAFAPMSGGTSQVNLNALVEALRFTPRDTGLDTDALTQIASYWQAVREFYSAFDEQVLPASGDLYEHEMPGGQYTNLFQQAKALGMADRWLEICKMYAEVNQMLGDIVKVTPTSKAVGDLALFMVANQLTASGIVARQREFSFPASILDLLSGRMGQPPGGFPKDVQKSILGDKPALTDRPGESLPAVDMDRCRNQVTQILAQPATDRQCATWLMYPKVFEEHVEHQRKYGDVSVLPTPYFFHGPEAGEEFAVDIEEGKRLIIKYLTVGQPRPDGTRTVFFELNGQPREVEVLDRSLESSKAKRVKADPGDPTHVAASMPGMVIGVAVKQGDRVIRGQKLVALEAMKMETSINSEREGEVAQLFAQSGIQVEAGDLLLVIK
jgi:pyruvate carboxylase